MKEIYSDKYVTVLFDDFGGGFLMHVRDDGYTVPMWPGPDEAIRSLEAVAERIKQGPNAGV